jgi:hypothetical protein
VHQASLGLVTQWNTDTGSLSSCCLAYPFAKQAICAEYMQDTHHTCVSPSSPPIPTNCFPSSMSLIACGTTSATALRLCLLHIHSSKAMAANSKAPRGAAMAAASCPGDNPPPVQSAQQAHAGQCFSGTQRRRRRSLCRPACRTILIPKESALTSPFNRTRQETMCTTCCPQGCMDQAAQVHMCMQHLLNVWQNVLREVATRNSDH